MTNTTRPEANPYRVNREMARLFSQEIVTFPLSAEQMLRSKSFISNRRLLDKPDDERLTGDDETRDWEILPEGMLNASVISYIHPDVLAYVVEPKHGFFGWPTKTSRQYDLWKEELLVPKERLMVVAVDTEGAFGNTMYRPSFFIAPVLRDGFGIDADMLLNLYTQWVRAPDTNDEKNARLKMYVAMTYMKCRKHPERLLNERGQGKSGYALPAVLEAAKHVREVKYKR